MAVPSDVPPAKAAHADASTAVGAPAGARPSKRRRRRPVWLVVGGVLLWLIGQGMGWFASAPSGERGVVSDSAQGGTDRARLETHGQSGIEQGRASKLLGTGKGAGSPGASLAAMSAVGGEPSGAVPDGAVAADLAMGAAAGLPSGETGSPAAEPEVASDTADENAHSPERSPSMASDRFNSLMSLLDVYLGEGAYGSASGALQRLQAQSLSATQQQQLAAFANRLLPLRQDLEANVLELLKKGEVLAADRCAMQLITAGQWRPQTLADAAPHLAIGDDWQRSLDGESGTVPAPTPLARNRRVRVRWRDQVRMAVVASSRSDQVTVRLRTDSGQSFPTVKAMACEPTDSNASEAIEMGFVAVHANAPRLARLWLLRAGLLSADALTTRGAQLLALLR